MPLPSNVHVCDPSGELHRWRRATSRDLLYGCLNGLISAENSYELLSRQTDSGSNCYAGQIALEAAYRSEDDPSTWLDNTRSSLTRAVESKRLNGYGSRAALLMCQLPAFEKLIKHGLLPDEALASSVYQDTLKFSNDLLRQTSENRLNANNSSRVQGVIGELAVLLLAQRFSLMGVGSETWFPLTSFLSQDLANLPDDTINHAWDLSIYTDHGGNADPRISYKVDIKRKVLNENGSSPENQAFLPIDATSSIVRIAVKPDLVLPEERGDTASEIISNLTKEQSSSERKIEARTELLLELLEAHPKWK